MGRESRKPQPTPAPPTFQLERGDYFELIESARLVEALVGELYRMKLELSLKEAEFHKAVQRKHDLAEKCAATYGYSATDEFTFDHATHTLTRVGAKHG